MIRKNVESSKVEFARGAIYQYQNVSHEVYQELAYADSVGKYFNKYIAKNYEYEKVNNE